MHRSFLSPLVFVVILFSCGENNRMGANVVKTENTTSPVETSDPPSEYQTAFPGQTRIAAAKTITPYEGRIVTDKLDHPWGIVQLPDGRFLITEKRGAMRIVSGSGQIASPIAGVPAVNAGGQGGLLGITLDPAFTVNRMIYWSFSENTASGNLTAVGKASLSADEQRLENVQVIYRATPAYRGSLHYGSRVVFDRTGNLLVSTGERSDIETRPQAQDLNSALGKIIRITTNGQPAAGNPFIGNSGARPEIYTYGHRNVQGLAIHPATGDVWENEFGPRGGDELNLIKAGLNYGWPLISYGKEYNGKKVGPGISKQKGLEQPVYFWDPVLSPSGMTFYSGDKMQEWKNNLFITGLNSNHIARLVITNNKVTGEEKMLSDQGQRFRDITQGKDGALYAVTDEGRLYRIGRK
ncbi:MAG: PQQ-dependent sugar dehydrogenase [Ferruginibacter sp.]